MRKKKETRKRAREVDRYIDRLKKVIRENTVGTEAKLVTFKTTKNRQKAKEKRIRVKRRRGSERASDRCTERLKKKVIDKHSRHRRKISHLQNH